MMLNKITEILNKSVQTGYKTAFQDILSLDWTSFIDAKKIPVSEECYTRIGICSNEEHELIIVSWSKGQCTPPHNHDDQNCFFSILRGSFEERSYTHNGKLNLINSHQLELKQIQHQPDSNIYHSLHNQTDGVGLSLHLYVNPLKNCDWINEEGVILNTGISNHFEWDLLSNN